jgi:hypothetical protein
LPAAAGAWDHRGIAANTNSSDRACRLCGGATRIAFEATILSRHRVDYLHCTACDQLQTARPHWLEEAYARPINIEDTGLVQRNLLLSRHMALLLFEGGLREGPFLDYAGGYGLMTRLMRDYGFDFRWTDPYAQNLFATGFEAALEGRFTAISAFEVLEHMVEPAAEVGALLAHTDTLVCSTELRPEPIPARDWPYYGFGHGQHIGFFSRQSLQALADRLAVRLLSDGAFFHVFTRNRRLALPPLRGLRGRMRFKRMQKQMRPLTVADSRRFE